MQMHRSNEPATDTPCASNRWSKMRDHSKRVTVEETVAGETAELLMEAAEARQLATLFQDKLAVTDLLLYASALESHAAKGAAMSYSL